MKMIIELFEAFDFTMVNWYSTDCTFKTDLTTITISSNGIVIDDSIRVLRVPYSQINAISAIDNADKALVEVFIKYRLIIKNANK